METLIFVGTGALRVIVACAVLALLAPYVAVRVTIAGLGTADGAVYVMGTPEALDVAESVPQVAALQPEPLSVQVTFWFCWFVVTVAVNCCVPPGAWMLAVVGERDTVVEGAAVRVITA